MTGKKYLRRKRILGVSAIVLAMLLMALPVFSRATENVNHLYASFEGCKTIAEMCEEKNYSTVSNTMMMIDKVECVSAKEGEGWVQISEDIYIKLDNYILSIYVPSGVEKIIPNTCKEMFFYFGSGNDTQRSFYRAQSFDVNAFISKLDTSSVTDMSRMFQAVRRAQTLEVTGFNTSNVTDMSFMFMGCDDLQSLDLTGFDTGSVTDMQQMFDTCQSLQTLDLSSFETSRVTSMSYMFCDCSNLETLNLSNFTVTDACDVDNMLTGCSKLNIIHTPTSTAKEIALPDTYYHLQEDGTWEMDGENIKAYPKILINKDDADPKSMILIKDDAFPTITPAVILSPTPTASPTTSPTGMAFDSPAVSPTVTPESTTSPTVTGSPSPSATVSPTVSPQVSPSPVVTVTPIPSPVTTPTPKPTQNTGKGTLVIVDNRADQTGTGQIAATVSNLVGNLKLIIEDDDGADIKKIQPLKKGQILIPYDIYLIDSYGTRYTNFGSCTITLPIPDSLDLTKGTLTVVAAKSSNVLENVSSTKLVKANINCVQFTATHFSEYGLLWTPYTELTGAVSPSVTPSGTTPKTTAEAATAAAKATSSAGGSGSSGSSSSGSSSSSSASSSSGTTSRGYTVVPVAGVKGYSNAKDMPKTGDGDVYRILGAIILFLFGAIELISSIRVKNVE